MTDISKEAVRPDLYETAQARRYYHHVVHGGRLTDCDVGRMVEYIETRDARIAELEAALATARADALREAAGVAGVKDRKGGRPIGQHGAGVRDGRNEAKRIILNLIDKEPTT